MILLEKPMRFSRSTFISPARLRSCLRLTATGARNHLQIRKGSRPAGGHYQVKQRWTNTVGTHRTRVYGRLMLTSRVFSLMVNGTQNTWHTYVDPSWGMYVLSMLLMYHVASKHMSKYVSKGQWNPGKNQDPQGFFVEKKEHRPFLAASRSVLDHDDHDMTVTDVAWRVYCCQSSEDIRGTTIDSIDAYDGKWFSI